MPRPPGRTVVVKACRHCKESFESFPCAKRKFCSRTCAVKHHNKQTGRIAALNAKLNPQRAKKQRLKSEPMKRAVLVLIDVGIPAAMVARIFGVSRQRIHQIVKECQ